MARKKPQATVVGAGADAQGDYTMKYDVEEEQRKFLEAFEQSQLNISDPNFKWPTYEEEYADARQRAWWFILYPESMNPDTFKILSELGIRAAISPLHDRDHWPDGTLKKAHFHVIVYKNGKATKKNLEGLVKILGGVQLEPVDNLVGACRYLAHLDIQPDKVEADRGKVRYSVDDIVCFNGFDIHAYIKATQTQISQALKELYAIIREYEITAYSKFIDLVYDRYPEYEFVMSNSHVCSQISLYVRSRYAVAHKDDEHVKMKAQLEGYEKQINRLIGALGNDVERKLAND